VNWFFENYLLVIDAGSECECECGAGLAVGPTLLRLEVERLALDDFQILKNFEKSSMKSFQITLSLLMLSTEGTLAVHNSFVMAVSGKRNFE
jgi:hypothetical protein